MPAESWERDVLKTLQAPITTGNLKLLRAWQRAEGGHTHNTARWNWLNTTKGKQFPSMNSVGVRVFPDYRTGISYTADTIIGGYPGIVQALRSGKPYSQTYRDLLVGDFSKWVSGDRGTRPDYGHKILGMKVSVPKVPAETLASASTRRQPRNRNELDLSMLAFALDDGDDFWDLVAARPLDFPEMSQPISVPETIEPALDADAEVGGSIQKAISVARQQIGKPYVWGAESPDEGGFDCSGLIDYAFRKAGIPLPVGRLTTWNAIKLGRSVKGSKLLPGDWVISNGGKHMTMYIGNGKVIAAPRRGTNVQVQKMPSDVVDIRRYRGPKA